MGSVSMQKTKNKSFFIISAVIYAVLFALLIYSSINSGEYDLLLNTKLYNPQSTFSSFFEDYAQAVFWVIWGPSFAIIFLCRRDLNGCLEVINRIFQKIKPVKNVRTKVYKSLNFILKAVETLGFAVLCTIGWKKVIENVTKNILKNMQKENLSQLVYFAISFAVAVISIWLFSLLGKEKLKNLEGFALSAILLGISFKLVEECKTITHRVRFREMVAYSNGFFNEKGLSEGKDLALRSQMVKNTDFGAFTPWYKKSADSGVYSYHLFSRTDSFPSGHTTSACAVLLSALVCNHSEKMKKFTFPVVCLCMFFVALMGYTRLIMGAHYLSDVVFAAIIGYTLFLFVNKIYDIFKQKKILYN